MFLVLIRSILLKHFYILSTHNIHVLWIDKKFFFFFFFFFFKENIYLGPVVQNLTKLLANMTLISILKYGKYIDIFC